MSKKSHPIFVVDAFSANAFGGNPAAVCLLTQDISDAEKQRIAAEMNLSETAFVIPKNPVGSDVTLERAFSNESKFGLRWFTPTTEVPLCGHATLATAAVIFSKMLNQNDTLEFETKSSGWLKCKNVSTSNGPLEIEMGLPMHEADRVDNWRADKQLAELVKLTVGEDLFIKVSDVLLTPGMHKTLVVRLSDGSVDQAGFESLPVPAAKLNEVETGGRVWSVMLTVRGEQGGKYDFLSRMFAVWLGVDEDPVCGSVNLVAASYWKMLLGSNNMLVWQCSSRGGMINIQIPENEEDRIAKLKGQACVVMEGKISY